MCTGVAITLYSLHYRTLLISCYNCFYPPLGVHLKEQTQLPQVQVAVLFGAIPTASLTVRLSPTLKAATVNLSHHNFTSNTLLLVLILAR